MAYLLRFSEAFEADVEGLFDWLFGRDLATAFRFRDSVTAATASLVHFPTANTVVEESALYKRTVRRKLFCSGTTAYRLLYTVYEAGEQEEDAVIYVLRVMHGAARPILDADNE